MLDVSSLLISLYALPHGPLQEQLVATKVKLCDGQLSVSVLFAYGLVLLYFIFFLKRLFFVFLYYATRASPPHFTTCVFSLSVPYQDTCVKAVKPGPLGRKCRISVEAKAPWDTEGEPKSEAFQVEAAEVRE